MAMERFSLVRITCTNSFPLEQKARYLPSGEMAAESNGLSPEYDVSGLIEILLSFSSGFSGCCRIRQRTNDPVMSVNKIPTKPSFHPRERISRDKTFGG